MYTTKRHRNHRDVIALVLNIAALTTGVRRATIYKKVATITHLAGTIREILAKAPAAALDAFLDTVDLIILLRHTPASYGRALPGIAPALQAVRINGIASAEYQLDILQHLEREEAEWNNMIHLQDSPPPLAPETIDQVPYSAVANSGFSFAQEEPSGILVADAPVRATTRKKRPSRATGAATGTPTGKVAGTPVRPVAGPTVPPGDNPGDVLPTAVYRKKGNKYTVVKRRAKGECLYTKDNSGNYLQLQN